MHLQSTAPAPAALETPTFDEELRAVLASELRGVQADAPRKSTDAVVLAYERVSTSVQVSIPDQKRAIEDDCAKYGMEVSRHRDDVGSRWDNDRPDYRALHRDIESKQFTHLWLFNADRLGGDDQEFVATVRKAQKSGMIVRDTTHGEITDDLATILGLVSYWEIKACHYRVMNALTGKHLEGKKLGRIPVGYEPQCRLHPCRCGLHGKHKPAEPRASQVQELFRRYAGGETLAVLRRWWNAETGERRTDKSLKGVLRDPYYVGIIVNCRTRNSKVQGKDPRDRKEWKIGMHDYPLIDPATFSTVQERLKSQENVGQQRSRQPSHPMVGLLHCVECRRRLHYQRNRYSAVWECPLCDRNRSVRKIEGAIHGLLAAIPFPEDAAIADYAADHARLEAALKQELAAIAVERDRLNRRRKTWREDLGDGTMSKEDYREAIAENDTQLEELRTQEAALQDSNLARPGRVTLLTEVREALQAMGNWTSMLQGRDVEELRGLYRAMIRAIRIDFAAGRMTVEYTDALARWCGTLAIRWPCPPKRPASAVG